LYVCFCLGFTQRANAQTDADALMIPKNYFCAPGIYTTASWDHYWEGTFKRDAPNLGTVSSNVYMLGLVIMAYQTGSTYRLWLPYVTTNASAGTLRANIICRILAHSLNGWQLKRRLAKGY
jgi:hypothetical protein